MKVLSSVEEALSFRTDAPDIAFVPTMGYLHEGHKSLLDAGRKRARTLVLSIFVNPTQFGPREDFAQYPRDIERDLDIAKSCNVDAVFLPSAEDIYQQGYATYVEVEGLSDKLCGEARPGHFRGVATVVAKLFNIIRPRVAVFGKKDYQQYVIIKRLTRDLNLGVDIVGLETVRDSDGLALSSRNTYLAAEQRSSALGLPEGLLSAKDAFLKGETDSKRLISIATEKMQSRPGLEVEYVRLVSTETLDDVEKAGKETFMAAAVRAGKTRLIDNVEFF